MSLQLTYKAETTVPVEIEGFTPTWAKDRTLAEIGQFEIFHGNQKLPLSEMFELDGNASNLHLDFHGNLSGVHWIGAHMTEGRSRFMAPLVGISAAKCRGGKILVHGDAKGWGRCRNARWADSRARQRRPSCWCGYRGSTKGMTGGTILIDGDVGNEVGLTMRRGMIAVGGRAGDVLGFNMIAGTVLVFGECGIRPGAGMRRGTLGLLGPNPPSMLPSFRYACTARPQVLSVMFNELRGHGFAIDDELVAAECKVFNGDLVALGRGEILVRLLSALYFLACHKQRTPR